MSVRTLHSYHEISHEWFFGFILWKLYLCMSVSSFKFLLLISGSVEMVTSGHAWMLWLNVTHAWVFVTFCRPLPPTTVLPSPASKIVCHLLILFAALKIIFTTPIKTFLLLLKMFATPNILSPRQLNCHPLHFLSYPISGMVTFLHFRLNRLKHTGLAQF